MFLFYSKLAIFYVTILAFFPCIVNMGGKKWNFIMQSPGSFFVNTNSSLSAINMTIYTSMHPACANVFLLSQADSSPLNMHGSIMVSSMLACYNETHCNTKSVETFAERKIVLELGKLRFFRIRLHVRFCLEWLLMSESTTKLLLSLVLIFRIWFKLKKGRSKSKSAVIISNSFI